MVILAALALLLLLVLAWCMARVAAVADSHEEEQVGCRLQELRCQDLRAQPHQAASEGRAESPN